MRLSAGQAGRLAARMGGGDPAALQDWLQAAGFDADGYLADNPNLAAKGLAARDAISHFLNHGYAESRRLTLRSFPAGLDALAALRIPDAGYRNQLCAAVTSAQMARSAGYLWGESNSPLAGSLRQAGGTPFTVIGDSHANLYRRAPATPAGWWAPMPLICGGGSAVGLSRIASRSGFGARIMAWAARNRPADGGDWPVFLKFGQVDVEFVWIFNRIRTGATRFDPAEFTAFASAAAASYLGFIADLTSKIGHARLRVCSIFPPALADATWAQGYVNANVGLQEGDRPLAELAEGIRGLEIPDLPARTALHGAFNDMLRDGCARSGLRFIDDMQPFLGADGVLDGRFIPHGQGRDHHLDFRATTGVIEAQIAENL